MAMDRQIPRKYLRYKDSPGRLSLLEKTMLGLAGTLLSPFYWALAYIYKTPGLQFRSYFLRKAIHLVLERRSLDAAYRLMVMPLDSFRYFEFDFMWGAIAGEKVNRYLDISSPRLFPLMVADRKSGAQVHLINPDKRDLKKTQALAADLGLGQSCHLHPSMVADADLSPGYFDLITCMSVLEHIDDDKEAIQKFWELLSTGGRLLITVPCASSAQEEYMNQNDYNLSNPDGEGFIFFQRFYDQALLQERIFSVIGLPVRHQIFAEKIAGKYQETETRKREDKFFSYWKAPLDMGKHYEFRSDLHGLPGIGVIGLEFVKQ